MPSCGAAVGEHDAAELWRNDGALRPDRLAATTPPVRRQAARCTKTARRLRELPVTAGAYRDGVLSGGAQIQAIMANLKDRTVGLFARPRDRAGPRVGPPVGGRRRDAMQDWARRPAVVGDGPEPVLPERSLHLSRVLDGRRELTGSFDPEGGAVIATALRMPHTATWRANPPLVPPSDAPTPSSTSAAGSWTTNTAPRRPPPPPPSTSSPPSTTSTTRTRPAGGRHHRRPDHPGAPGLRRRHPPGRHRRTLRILDWHHHPHRPRPLFNALVIRDRHCRYPGDRPPDWTEAHQPLGHGGPTALDISSLLCTRHHHLLTRPGWHAKLLPDTTLEVTDPRDTPTPAPTHTPTTPPTQRMTTPRQAKVPPILRPCRR